MNRRTRELIKQLQSESPKERYVAAAELAKLKDIDALPALNKVATFDQNENVRTMAFNAARFLNQIKNQMDQDELRRRVMAADDDDSDDQSGPFWEDDDDDDDDDDTDPKRKSGVFGSKPDIRKSKPRIRKEDLRRDDDSQSGIRVTASDLGIPTSIMFGDDDDDDDTGDSLPIAKRTKKDSKTSRKAVDLQRRKRRRRTTFRFVLWLSAIIGLLGLVLVAYDELQAPRTREDALAGLDGWLDEMIQTTGIYAASAQGSTFDCSAYVGNGQFNIPTGPDWAERDGKNQEDLGAFFDAMEAAADNLSTVQNGFNVLCEGRENESTVEIPLGAGWSRLVAETTILHLSAAQNALDDADSGE